MSFPEDLLRCVYRQALLSPDPSTQIGAALVRNGDIINETLAYNRFPVGVKYTDERWKRPAKYSYVEHGERNAILQAAKAGIATKGLTMVATWAACADCARAIVGAGIKVLIRHAPDHRDQLDRWHKSVAVGDTILQEGGVGIWEIPTCLSDGGYHVSPVLRDGEPWLP